MKQDCKVKLAWSLVLHQEVYTLSTNQMYFLPRGKICELEKIGQREVLVKVSLKCVSGLKAAAARPGSLRHRLASHRVLRETFLLRNHPSPERVSGWPPSSDSPQAWCHVRCAACQCSLYPDSSSLGLLFKSCSRKLRSIRVHCAGSEAVPARE